MKKGKVRTIMTTLELQKMANEVRKSIVTGGHSAKAGHPGGSLAAADLSLKDIQHRDIMQLWHTEDIFR